MNDDDDAVSRPDAGKKRRWPLVLAVVGGVLAVAAGGLAIAAPSLATSIADGLIRKEAERAGWRLELRGFTLSPWSGSGAVASFSARKGDLKIAGRSLTFHVATLQALRGDGLEGLRSVAAESFTLTSGARTQEITQLLVELKDGPTWATRTSSLTGTTMLAGRPVPIEGRPVEGGFDVTAGPVEVRAGSFRVLGLGADAMVRAEAHIELREEHDAVRVSTRPSASLAPSAGTDPLGSLLQAAGAVLSGNVDLQLHSRSEVVRNGRDLFAILGTVARQMAALPEPSP